MNERAGMEGVGEKLITALRTECTSGQPDSYALRRLSALVDELSELDKARPLIARTYHRSREVTERRKKLAIAEYSYE